MTVTQSCSLSLTYTSLRMYVSQAAPVAVPASSENTPAPSAGDTVTLSPEATAPPVVDETSASAQPAGGTVEEPAAPAASLDEPSAPSSRAARRAEVLHNALDADEDGAISKEEFVEGAMALLRRAGAHHHRHRVHAERHDHDDHEGRGTSHLERRLDRLFERVDASGDGNVDQAELTDALAKVTRERRPDTTRPPAPSASQETPSPETSALATVSEPQTQPAAAMSYTSVTVVIAVKQYTSIAAMNA